MRWALNLLHHGATPRPGLRPRADREGLLEGSAERLPIYLYGSTTEVLEALAANLVRRFPGLEIAGYQPSKFRRVSASEKRQVVEQIRGSGAKLVLLGLGCPRQEVWAYEYREALSMPVLAVGAAFDYHSGRLRRPPAALQRLGLEWAFRLSLEPRRLWRRYLLLNPYFVLMVVCQLTRPPFFSVSQEQISYDQLNYG